MDVKAAWRPLVRLRILNARGRVNRKKTSFRDAGFSGDRTAQPPLPPESKSDRIRAFPSGGAAPPRKEISHTKESGHERLHRERHRRRTARRGNRELQEARRREIRPNAPPDRHQGDGEYVELAYHVGMGEFDRIRRITGYLVGTLDRFNDGKRAEEADRVKHSVSECSCGDMRAAG